MIKRIVRHGNTHALILDSTLLQLAGLSPDGCVAVSVDKGRIVIKRTKEVVLPPLTPAERRIMRTVS